MSLIGKSVPDFELPSTGGTTIRIKDLLGKAVVLFFYPKDSTPGCTIESQQFRDNYAAFENLGVEIFGISRDSLASHQKFKTQFGLPFELLSDSEEKACTLFNVMKDKKMYGRDVRGIERSTFVIDRNGIIVGEWRNVKPDGHAMEILEFVKRMTKG